MLVSSSIRIPESPEALLTPRVAALLDRLDVRSRNIRSGTMPGERRSKRRGQSVEFDDFRPYVTGDDLRHLDWNAYARLDRFMIKLFRAEEDLAITLVLDASPSMYAGEDETGAGGDQLDAKVVHAARLAMAIGAIALAKQNRVSVLRFGGRTLGRFPPSRGRRSIERLARFLLEGLHEPMDPTAARDLTTSLREVGRARSGRGVVVLLSDLLIRGDAAPGLRAMVARDRAGTDGAVLRVLTPSELDPAASSGGIRGDLRLEDIEAAGPATEVTVSKQLLKRYREKFAEHEAQLRRDASRLGLSYHTLTTAEPIADVVGGTLRRLGLLG
ncbi:MAG: DUF58 domain-containing protein [Planctomycetota bacterium]